MEKCDRSVYKRNGEIDILRFLFASFIVFAHFNDSFMIGFFNNGHIGVEFFFLVSGFFLAKSALKKRNCQSIPLETWRYLTIKISKFYFQFIVSVLIWFIAIYVIIRRYDIRAIFRALYGSIPHFTLIFMGLSIKNEFYVSGHWYLSVMVILVLLLYPFILKYGEIATTLVFPCLSIIIAGYYYSVFHRVIVGVLQRIGLFNAGMLRGAMEMMAGAACFMLKEYLDSLNITKRDRIILTFTKILFYALVFIYAFGFIKNKSYDLYSLLFCILAVTFSFSNITYHIESNIITDYLGKLSLSLYLFHGIVRFAGRGFEAVS